MSNKYIKTLLIKSFIRLDKIYKIKIKNLNIKHNKMKIIRIKYDNVKLLKCFFFLFYFFL